MIDIRLYVYACWIVNVIEQVQGEVEREKELSSQTTR